MLVVDVLDVDDVLDVEVLDVEVLDVLDDDVLEVDVLDVDVLELDVVVVAPGHPPGGAGMMSPWSTCAGRALKSTVISTNGFVSDPVRWQMVILCSPELPGEVSPGAASDAGTELPQAMRMTAAMGPARLRTCFLPDTRAPFG